MDIILAIAIMTIVIPAIGGLVGALIVWQFAKRWLKEKFLTRTENCDMK